MRNDGRSSFMLPSGKTVESLSLSPLGTFKRPPCLNLIILKCNLPARNKARSAVVKISWATSTLIAQWWFIGLMIFLPSKYKLTNIVTVWVRRWLTWRLNPGQFSFSGTTWKSWKLMSLSTPMSLPSSLCGPWRRRRREDVSLMRTRTLQAVSSYCFHCPWFFYDPPIDWFLFRPHPPIEEIFFHCHSLFWSSYWLVVFLLSSSNWWTFHSLSFFLFDHPIDWGFFFSSSSNWWNFNLIKVVFKAGILISSIAYMESLLWFVFGNLKLYNGHT